MGKECPGPEKCAPANHHMQIMWRDTDQEIADPHPLCPIALTTEALHTWAPVMLSMAIGPADEEDNGFETDEQARDRALSELKLDQDR